MGKEEHVDDEKEAYRADKCRKVSVCSVHIITLGLAERAVSASEIYGFDSQFALRQI
jgi:hypothetical protein